MVHIDHKMLEAISIQSNESRKRKERMEKQIAKLRKENKELKAALKDALAKIKAGMT